MAVPESHSDGIPDSGLASDKALRPFLAPSFDPADFLNATLPSWSLSTTQKQADSASLTDLTTQTQSLLSQLNAQITRLSNTLTQMTDEILRSGGRLAYEVEVLQSDTSSLADALTEGLRVDIERFVPEGLNLDARRLQRTRTQSLSYANGLNPTEDHLRRQSSASTNPEDVAKLHTLTVVRERLDSVVKVFGEAMEWVIPPSEVSLKSSIISVASPEPGSDNQSKEAKGREYAEKVRSEIADIISGDKPEDDAYESAMKRIESLRRLAEVFKGTAEEKARLKFLDNLTKMVEDKKKPRLGEPTGGYFLRPSSRGDSRSISPSKQ